MYVFCQFLHVFFFKQKTAYEMRISDWSSDVCSSDLSPDDIYISPSQIRRFNLHTGDSIEGEVRTPKDGERYFALVKVDKVNGIQPEAIKHRIMFENLTPLHPNEVMTLERDIKSEENITGRIMDIFAPMGKGQRALIVASRSEEPRLNSSH